MGECALVRRGGKAKISVKSTTVNLGAFQYDSGYKYTGVSVSDMTNPTIGENVFVSIAKFTMRCFGSYNDDTVNVIADIYNGLVRVKANPQYSNEDIADVYVTVYKIYS